MNINRLRPTGVKKENLDMWLSSVIHDAIRDAREAGLSDRSIAHMMHSIARDADRTGCVQRKYRVTALVPSDGSDVIIPEAEGRGPFRVRVQGEIEGAIIVRYDEEVFRQMSPQMMEKFLQSAVETVKKATGNDNVLILGNEIELVRLVEER